MAQGMLGSLPPGLRGMLAAEQMGQQRSNNQLQQMGGMLSLQNAMVEQEMTPLKLEQLKIAIANAKQNQQLRQRLMGGAGGTSSSPMAFGEGGMSLPGGGQGNILTGQTMPAQAAQGGNYGVSPEVMNMMLSGDPGLIAAAKAMQEQQKPIVGREGAPIMVRQPDGTLKMEFYAPKSQPGVQMQFGPQGVTGATQVPGYAQAISGIEGAVTGATEDARAARDIVQIPGQPVQTRAQLINRVGGGARPQGAPVAAPAPAAPGMASPAAPSPLVVPTPAETAGAAATATGRAKGGVEFENSVLDAGRVARNNLTQLQIIAPMLDKLPTGPIYNTMLNGASLFKQFGMDVGKMGEQVGPAQASTAILNRMALAVRNPSGGEGMPGAMSDADREYLLRTIPNLSNVQDGNRTLIQIMSNLEQRKVDEAQIVSKMQAAKKSSNEIRDALSQFANSRQMFGQ